ncbi:hypothetical protein Vafri_9247, partial [Volvox africanus]
MISSKGLGLLFLVVTSAAWIGASFITQALVSRGEEEPAALEPWLLTLICSSTLMLYLPIGHFARKRARYEGRVARAARSPKPRARQRKAATPDDVALEHATGCLHPRRRAAAAAASAVVDSTAVEVEEISEEEGGEASDAEAGASGRARVARSGGDQAAAARAVRGMERQPLLHTHKHPQHGGGSDAASAAAQAAAMSNGDVEGMDGCGGDSSGEVETSQIVRAAFVVAPVWFAAQLAFTASLEFTSVTSNTVLSSCSSLFVYLGSLALGQEIGSALRFASVIAAMAGTTLVALGDKRNESGSSGGGSEGGGGGGGSNPLFGDALTLIAAALYALYTIMMKRLLVKDDAIVMALFFGTIGVLYFSVLAPVAGALALAGSSVVRRVTSRALGLALVQGLIDYVAADYAWARAVMLLGPTATSCGLAMQIPAAGIIDALLNGSRLSWSESPGSLAQFVIGSLLIICGFIGVSLEPRVVSALWRRCCERGEGRFGGVVVAAPSSGSGSGGGGGSRGGRGGGNADGGGSWPVADSSEGGELLRPEGRSAGLVGPAGKAAISISISEDGNVSGGPAGELLAARVGLLDGEVRRGRRGSGGGGGAGPG